MTRAAAAAKRTVHPAARVFAVLCVCFRGARGGPPGSSGHGDRGPACPARLPVLDVTMAAFGTLRVRGVGAGLLPPDAPFALRLRGGGETRFVWNAQGCSRLKTVEIAGTWDGWEVRQQLLYEHGQGWVGTKSLEPGRYEFKFILDDTHWTHSEDVPKHMCALGVYNNVLEIGSEGWTGSQGAWAPPVDADSSTDHILRRSLSANKVCDLVSSLSDRAVSPAMLNPEGPSVPGEGSKHANHTLRAGNSESRANQPPLTRSSDWRTQAEVRAEEKMRLERMYKDAADAATARKNAALLEAKAKAASVEQISADAKQALEQAALAEREEAHYRWQADEALKSAAEAADRRAKAHEISESIAFVLEQASAASEAATQDLRCAMEEEEDAMNALATATGQAGTASADLRRAVQNEVEVEEAAAKAAAEAAAELEKQRAEAAAQEQQRQAALDAEAAASAAHVKAGKIWLAEAKSKAAAGNYMAARAASGFAAAEFKSAEQEADVELARQMEALDKELTLLEQESMDRKAEEEERRVAEETENKRRQAEEERLRQAEEERLARVEELQRKVEEERLRAQEEAAEEERRREEDRRAKARAQEEEMQAREALARKKRLAEDLAVRKHSLDKAEELKRMAEDERKREELWRKQQEAESQRIEIEARTKAEQAQQEATASAKKREEERRLAAATEETEDAHLRRPESWPRRQVQGADQQLEAPEREGEQHRRTRPDAHALRRQEVEAAAELARHDVEMFIQKEITGKEKVFRERAMMQHFKHAEAAFHESYAACARRDYIGAAAMRETAFQQYGLYSSLGGDAEPGFVEALHELGEEIRNIAQQSLAMQRETARQAHAKAAAAHAAAREAEATEINQIRLREQEEREDEQARQEGRPSPRRGRYGQTPPRNHPSALSEDHQAALSQEAYAAPGPYYLSEVQEAAAQKKREEQEAAAREQEVEEEALRIVNNIQKFVEKFDVGAPAFARTSGFVDNRYKTPGASFKHM